MRLLDEQHTKAPFYGVLRMTAYLRKLGFVVNEKRVRRLLRLMGLEAIYPKPKLSKANFEHRIYPYLLRDVEIMKCNQVWSADITYIRLARGFIYLVAIIDWFSRYVLKWDISTTLEAGFCIETLESAVRVTKPEIFNTDQGSQFTAKDFVNILLEQSVQVSMDGKGRAFDNIFVERLWRSLKYEEVYLHDYSSVTEAREGINRYFEFYNNERLHQSLNYRTPKDVYFC
jgi:putative transposase